MKNFSIKFIFIFTCFFNTHYVLSQDIPPLPEAVSNNAVASVVVNDNRYIVSFNGLGSTKQASNIHNKTFIYSTTSGQWQRGPNVPTYAKHLPKGRLASSATSLNHAIYLLGGYTVDKTGHEVTLPDLYRFNVQSQQFTRLADIPVAVDDAVMLSDHQRYIYVISGWHQTANVNLVQVYDTQNNQWQQATPFAGTPVFGHAGALSDKTMVICDGVKIDYFEHKKRKFTAEQACYIGLISLENPLKITWHKLTHPNAKARYRMAACRVNSNTLAFFGGSQNPYNFNGIGYNTVPSTADNQLWLFHLSSKTWQLQPQQIASMDHRGMICIDDKLITVGGMNNQQQVLNQVISHQIH